MANFTIRAGDSFTIADTLEDATGAPVNIEGATIEFVLTPIGGGNPKINAAATNNQVGDGSDGTKGKVSYTSSAGDSNTAGLYFGYWTVTFAAGDTQTYPNVGYILVEVTAGNPATVGSRFAESTDLEARLGVSFTADEHIRANELLALASEMIQDETRQKIELVVDDTLSVRSTYDDRFRLPQRPVVDVSSVTLTLIGGNQTFDVPAETYYLDGDEIVRTAFPLAYQWAFASYARGWLGPLYQMTVVYTHGYATVPSLVKAVCMEMVTRAWVNPGSVARETVGNVSTVYDNMRFSPTGLLMTDTERAQLNDKLRRQSGSITLR